MGERRGDRGEGNAELLSRLGAVYKQINAPVGELGLDTLAASTKAIESGSATNDSEYTRFESEITRLTDARNDLASTISNALNAEEFNGQPIDHRNAERWIWRGYELLRWAWDMAHDFR
jgi:hypothetical protein